MAMTEQYGMTGDRHDECAGCGDMFYDYLLNLLDGKWLCPICWDMVLDAVDGWTPKDDVTDDNGVTPKQHVLYAASFGEQCNRMYRYGKGDIYVQEGG